MIDSPENLQVIKRTKARVIIYTELVFVLLPFVILALGNPSLEVLYNPEWSLAASILFGQTVARFVSGIAKQGVRNWHIGIFYVAIFMALSIISVYTYSIMLGIGKVFSNYMLLQLVLFFLSIITFVVFGAIGQRLMDMPERRKRQTRQKAPPKKSS